MNQQDSHPDLLSMTAEELEREIESLHKSLGTFDYLLRWLPEDWESFIHARDYIMRRLWMAERYLVELWACGEESMNALSRKMYRSARP